MFLSVRAYVATFERVDGFDHIWCGIYVVGGYPSPRCFQFPIVGNTNMADIRMCEVRVIESSDIDSLSKQLIAREGFIPLVAAAT